MSQEFSAELQAELLDDFYAEADEHLGSVRTQLALLEGALGGSAPDAATLDAIFRNIHSFKGISGMVGLRPAEQLAHAAEDYLRQLTRQTLTLTAAGFDLLVATIQRLEQIVTAHRRHEPIPEVASLAGRLAALNPSHAAPAPAPEPAAASAAPAPGPLASGLVPWNVTFKPSRELDQRGVNINAVRTRLAALGSIVSATPSVKPGGGFSFEFLVGLPQPPENPEAWAADGISFQPVASAAGAHTASPPLPAAVEESSLFVAPSHIVRVDLSRLDDLMRITGEMVIHRSRLEERIASRAGDESGLREVTQALARSLRDLRAAITRVRMVPVAEIFTRMRFVVRDLARTSGRNVRLVLQGQQTEIDKYLVERVKEPLLHLVRNAFSHGIETPEERVAAQKPAEATILLSAETAGEAVILRIRDDGRGIDPSAVARRAAELGVALPPQLDATGLLDVISLPGFSTRAEADRTAGRGVGMSVVRTTVRELGGTLSLETEPGRGTTFTLRLPLTLSIAEMLIVGSGTQTCAVPQGSVAEIIQVAEEQVRRVKRTEVVPYRNGVLPIVRLDAVFGSAAAARPQRPVLVVQSERGRAGLAVDRVHGQREVVVRPLRDPLLQVPGVAGATELGDGRPVLILDAVTLTQDVVRPPESETAGAPAAIPAS